MRPLKKVLQLIVVVAFLSLFLTSCGRGYGCPSNNFSIESSIQ